LQRRSIQRIGLIGEPRLAALAALIASTMDIARGGGPDAAGAGLMIDPADSIVLGLIEAAGFLISVMLWSPHLPQSGVIIAA
jgi:hypothetical protein